MGGTRRSTGVQPVKPGQYREYKVGGQTFTSVGGGAGGFVDRAKTALAGAVLRLASKVVPDSDTPTRIYTQAVLNRRTKPFTEKDFTQEELAGLATMVARAKAAGRTAINAGDVIDRTAGDPTATKAPGQWGSVVGRAAFTEDPKTGRITVHDTYDFNNYEQGSSAASKEGTGEFSPAAWYGRRALPSGVRGVPVSITLPAVRRQGAPRAANMKRGN